MDLPRHVIVGFTPDNIFVAPEEIASGTQDFTLPLFWFLRVFVITSVDIVIDMLTFFSITANQGAIFLKVIGQ